MDRGEFIDVANDCIARLKQSERGHKALKQLGSFISGAGAGLDEPNQRAISWLLDASYGEYAGTVRELIRGNDVE